MQESHIGLSAGDGVIVRDEPWTVVTADRYDAVTMVRLRGAGGDNRDEVRTFLTPYDGIAHTGTGRPLRHRSRDAVLRQALARVADANGWAECWTAAAARIDLYAWQLEPARAALRGVMRILLADQVGLGKTIQAALIVAELRARYLAERVLVLTPPSIRQQWAAELRDRFRLDSVVYDQQALAEAAAALPADVNPWAIAPLIISSIDLVKRAEVRAALEPLAFDILIVDEAHHLTPGSDRAAVVSELAARAAWVVLVTATPHSGDDGTYAQLCRVGDAGTEGMRVFRRARRDGGENRAVRSTRLRVRPTVAERALLDGTAAYVRALMTCRRDPGTQLVAAVIARRAASAADAACRTIRRRIALLETNSAPQPQPRLPWEEPESDEVPDSVLSAPGLPDTAAELEWLRRLEGLAQLAAAASSKVALIRRLVRRTTESILVFSEYRDVAQLVRTSLEDVCAVATLHGGLSARDRDAAVRAFTTGAARVLVATDAAGEGVNLQARCRLVVNLEPPWMPRRLEQRVGRVDRMGQRRRVHAIHLVHAGSFEDRVVARLEQRRSRAASVTRARLVDRAESVAAVTRRARAIAAQYGPPTFADAAYSSCGAGVSRRLTLVYAVPLVDGSGRAVCRPVIALRLDCPGWTRRLARGALRQLDASARLRGALAQQAERLVERVRHDVTPCAIAMARRLDDIAAIQARLDGTALWQGSLFDRRAEQQAHARHRSRAAVAEHVRRRRRAAEDLAHITALEPRLLAAWRD